MPLEADQRVVTDVTEEIFTENEETLSSELVKSNALVEAQEEFRFDRPSRTVILSVTTVFRTGEARVPYALATDFAPVFWGPGATSSVRPEALPTLSVTVDGTQFRCDGPTMATLADKELSAEAFAERCGG